MVDNYNKLMKEAVQQVQAINKEVEIDMTDEETTEFLEFISDYMITQEMKENYTAKLASDSMRDTIQKLIKR